MLALGKDRPKNWTALKFKSGDKWFERTWVELFETVERLACYLHKSGIRPGDRVALVAETRWEWMALDMAIMGIGAITVPIYPSQRSEEVRLILNDSMSKLLFLEDISQWQKWVEIRDNCPSVKSVCCIDNHSEIPKDVPAFDDLLDMGGEYVMDSPHLFGQRLSAQKGSDVATIIYTSGTTGEPKGVVLTHDQIMGEVAAVLSILPLSHLDTSLAFLPFAHILGRVESFVAITAGFTIAFAENVDRLRFNLPEVRPTLLIAVPRVFEKLHTAILAQAESNPAVQKVFGWAYEIGKQVSQLQQQGERIPFDLLAQHKVAEQVVFRPLRAKLGGRLRFAVSGGAPLPKEIGQFFHALGLLIIEGYGLTETTAAITANTPLSYKFGTVGRPLKDVEIRFDQDGEILVRGPMVMREYHDNASANASAFMDGFYRTGDIGELDHDGFLHITDRKKDLIKTAGGKYVAPQKLENLLKMSPFISQSLIHGDQEKYIVAVLTLSQEQVLKFARENDISYQDYATLCQHPQVKGIARSIVAKVNSQLASFETIKNFAILNHDFTVEAGELTPSLKVKRKFCSERYRDTIKALYE